MAELKYEVKPFYRDYCRNCYYNGCYPWNRNPLLLCSTMGGLFPAILFEDSTNSGCGTYNLVSYEGWEVWLRNEKSEAKDLEDLRMKARYGKIITNQIYPAEEVCMKVMK